MKISFQVIFYPLLLTLSNSCNILNNELNLNFDNKINKADIKIKMEVLASIPITEIYNGQNEFDIPDGYGENEWYFTYKDTLKGYIRHFKGNRHYKHLYKFTFYEKNGTYLVNIDIKGKDPMNKTVELIQKH